MLAGKTVLVTGGGRGIGRAVALAAAAQGASVGIIDAGVDLAGRGGAAAPANDTVAAIKAQGGQALASFADVSDGDAVAGAVAATLKAFGRLDAVVHCAGILRDAIWHRMTPEDWRAVIGVHLDGAFHLAHAATPHLRAQGSGSLVFMTSGAGLIGNLGQANYAAAKLGVVGLAQSIALDAARYGVRANCIAPVAWTRMIAAVAAPADGDAPPSGPGADRIAPLAVFLCSDAAAGITNQVFGVHGDEISVYSRPRPLHAVVREGGWSAEAIAATAMPALAPYLGPAAETAAEVLARGAAGVQRF